MPSPTEITIDQLYRLIGTPTAPVLIDVRIDADVADDPVLLPGAIPQAFDRASELISTLSGRRVVVYCQKGKKISQGVAAILRAEGIAAETLAGGQFAWRDAGYPQVPREKVPVRDHTGSTVWVTRHRPKIDRIACPWLIRRFVDPAAKFLFVAPDEVAAVAERFNATPFDMAEGFWSHRGEGGERCTFDTMVAEFELTFPALERLAVIVRAADTDRHNLVPEAAGLMAASLGYSRMYRDDVAQLEAAMSLYDAFYRWARDAHDESHDWPPLTAAAKGRTL